MKQIEYDGLAVMERNGSAVHCFYYFMVDSLVHMKLIF